MAKMLPQKNCNLFYDACRRAAFAFFDSLYRFEVHGLSHVPHEGGFVLACNHVSYFDPPAAGCALPRQIYYFARKTLFKPGLASWLLRNIHTIPVDRDGDSDISSIKSVLRLLHAGEGLLVFPEGTRAEDGGLGQAKRGVGMLACKSSVPVVPARVFGTFESYKKGMKLPQWGRSIHVVYGPILKPFDFDPGAEEKDRYQIAANRIMEAIAAIPFPADPGV